MNRHHAKRAAIRRMVALLVGLGTVLSAPGANAAELDDFREVSYLVFHRDVGFDRPEFSMDLLDGSVSIRFRRIPTGWRAILAPQVSSDRKQRFFRNMDPIIERGELVGIKVRVGVAPFSIDHYAKRRPFRWVMRIGEHRQMPITRGPEGIPVVPYADLIADEVGAEELDGIEGRPSQPDEDLEDAAQDDDEAASAATPTSQRARRDLQSAELRYARGDDTACGEFLRLAGEPGEVSSWAGLRLSDCLLRGDEPAKAIEVLRAVVRAKQHDAAVALALVRIDEALGRTLTDRFRLDRYEVHMSRRIPWGTAADELDYRAARALFFRGETGKALTRMEALLAARPKSPFFLDRTFPHAVRWRAIRDSALDGRWLDTARTYLRIPGDTRDMEKWAELHEYGARALREVSLPGRAVRVYLHLLASRDPRLDEPAVIADLAESYLEADDRYRAEVTLRYLGEKSPKLAASARIARLRGRLAQLEENVGAVAKAAAEVVAAEPPMDDGEDATFVVEAAVMTLDDEGLLTARNTLASAPGPVAESARSHLALAAGDCDALVRAAQPLELTDGRTALYAGACLMGDGRYDEAVVMVEAARVFAPGDVADPQMDDLLWEISESARWWQHNAAHLQDVGAARQAREQALAKREPRS